MADLIRSFLIDSLVGFLLFGVCVVLLARFAAGAQQRLDGVTGWHNERAAQFRAMEDVEIRDDEPEMSVTDNTYGGNDDDR